MIDMIQNPSVDKLYKILLPAIKAISTLYSAISGLTSIE